MTTNNEVEKQKNNRSLWNILLLFVTIIFAVVLVQQFILNPDTGTKELAYSEFYAIVSTTLKVKDCYENLAPENVGCLFEVTFRGTQVKGKYKPANGRAVIINFRTTIPSAEASTKIASDLASHGLKVSAEDQSDSRSFWMMIIFTALPLVIIIVLLLIILQLLRVLLRRV